MAHRTLALEPRVWRNRRNPARAPLRPQARSTRLLRAARRAALKPDAGASEGREAARAERHHGCTTSQILSPGKNEELIRVTAVGCAAPTATGSSRAASAMRTLARPLVLGHEIAGVIETGAHARPARSRGPGRPVWRLAICARADMGHLCRELKFAGHDTTDGGLRTLMAWPRQPAGTAPRLRSDDDGSGAAGTAWASLCTPPTSARSHPA